MGLDGDDIGKGGDADEKELVSSLTGGGVIARTVVCWGTTDANDNEGDKSKIGSDELERGEGDAGSCLVPEALRALFDPCFPKSHTNNELEFPLVLPPPARFTKKGLTSMSVGDLSGEGVDAAVV
jgi:hypothetical protein